MEKFLYAFFMFFLYSVFGYICECAYCSIKLKRLITNRGFLLGPYIPIYGFGAISIVLLLKKYASDPIALFVMGCLIATILEYITSYIMEKLFKARWWDYSSKKFNINGRVCLENSILFGIGGLALTYIVNPFFISMVDKINYTVFIVLSVLVFIAFFIDFIISVLTAYKLRENSIILKKISEEQVDKQVHEKVFKGKYFKRRMLGAFPDIKKTNVYNKINDLIKTRR